MTIQNNYPKWPRLLFTLRPWKSILYLSQLFKTPSNFKSFSGSGGSLELRRQLWPSPSGRYTPGLTSLFRFSFVEVCFTDSFEIYIGLFSCVTEVYSAETSPSFSVFIPWNMFAFKTDYCCSCYENHTDIAIQTRSFPSAASAIFSSVWLVQIWFDWCTCVEFR